MDSWNKGVFNFRCLIAEIFLGWALAWTPEGSKEQIEMARAADTYMRAIQP